MLSPKNSNDPQVGSLPVPPSHALTLQQAPLLALWREGLAVVLLVAICVRASSLSRSYEKVWGEMIGRGVCCGCADPALVSVDQRAGGPECKWNV
jgi:hypothetical protein